MPAKSWWTLVNFTWYKGQWKYVSAMNDVSIYIEDVEGNLEILKQLAAYEAQKIL